MLMELEELERKIKDLEPFFQKMELETIVLKKQIKELETGISVLNKQIKGLETRIRDSNKPEFDLEKLWEIHNNFKPKKEKTP